MEASHDMFMYGYSDEANALRAVVVEPKEELYTPSGEFQLLESDVLRDPVNKVSLHCQSQCYRFLTDVPGTLHHGHDMMNTT